MARVSGKRLLIALLLTLSVPFSATAGTDMPSGDAVDRLLLREQSVGAGLLGTSPAGTAGFAGFMNPTALAAEGDTLFVGDPGLRRVYRVELDSREVTPVAPLGGATPRLRVGIARSWFLIPPTGNVVREFDPDGKLRAEYTSVEFTQAVDALREPRSGRIWVFDFSGTVYEFSPGGSLLESRRILADRGTAVQAAVAGPEFAYVLDRTCACVIELDQHGLPMRMIADGELAFANDLAVDDYGRIWVTQQDQAQITLIDHNESLHHIDLRAVGLNRLSALTIAGGRLFAADPTTASVTVFRLLPPDSIRR